MATDNANNNTEFTARKAFSSSQLVKNALEMQSLSCPNKYEMPMMEKTTVIRENVSKTTYVALR
jgi:hypothetical protein